MDRTCTCAECVAIRRLILQIDEIEEAIRWGVLMGRSPFDVEGCLSLFEREYYQSKKILRNLNFQQYY